MSTLKLAKPNKAAPPGFTYVRGMLVRKPATAKPAAPEPRTAAIAPQAIPQPIPAQKAGNGPVAALEAPDIPVQTVSEQAPAKPARQARPRREWQERTARVPWRQYFFVWNPDADAPRARHETLEGARGCARDLAQRFPGQTFLIFKAELQGEEWVRREPRAAQPVGTQEPAPETASDVQEVLR
jgi:hypothetical protein